MCFHKSQVLTVKDIEKRYNVKLHDPEARDAFDIPVFHANGFSHPAWLIIAQQAPELLVNSTWGIVPQNKKLEEIESYHKESVRYGAGLNAQSEKLFDHFIYKNSAYTKRCLIPVTGFYEPHEHNKKKYPYLIHREYNELFCLAGIYTVIEDIVTYSILTKAASPLFEKIHNLKKRQPVIIREGFEEEWLNPDLTEKNIKDLINLQYNDAELEAYTVSKDLFSPKVNSDIESIQDKVVYSELY